MSIIIRPFEDADYSELKALYKQGHLYGGQFDEDRDSLKRLQNITSRHPHAVLMAEIDGHIVGTVSLIEDERVAWLFRFAVIKTEQEKEIALALYNKAKEVLLSRGHHQVLVYTDANEAQLKQRYRELGMHEGHDYTCFWMGLEQ